MQPVLSFSFFFPRFLFSPVLCPSTTEIDEEEKDS
jgi:hypothetical protein